MSTLRTAHPESHLLRNYLLGKLDPKASDEVEAHVQHCLECWEQFDRMKDDDRLVRFVRAVPRSPFLAQSLTAQPSTAQPSTAHKINPESSNEPRSAVPIPANSQASSLPQFTGYEVLKELGRGGMGIVYQAHHQKLDRVVAIKTLPPIHPARRELLSRLEMEAQVLARLQHPNILQIFEVGTHDGCSFAVLEFVDGCNLQDHLGDQPMPPHEAAELSLILANAMHVAHQRGIVHRDLKPQNILVEKATGTVKIADFGLAKALDSNSARTRTGMLLGTPAYMAPEQADGRPDDVSMATDVYGLGAILYRCLTGRGPFEGESTAVTLRAIVHESPSPPRSSAPGIPRDLETICLKCLEKEPGQRYAGAAELAEDLQRFLRGESILARPLNCVEHAWRWSRRNRLLANSILIIIMMMFVGLVYSSITTRRMTRLAHDRHFEAQRARLLQHEAETARDAAVEQRDQARWNQYVAEMNVASRVSRMPDGVRQVRDLTNRWRQTVSRNETDLRGWEWYFLASFGRREHMTFDVRAREVWNVEWTLDGRSLLTIGHSKLQRWDIQRSTEEVFDLGDVMLGYALEISPDGRWLAIAAADRERTWYTIRNAATFALVWRYDVDVSQHPRMKWSPDGRRLATTGIRSKPIIWDAQSGEKIAEFADHDPMVPDLCWSPDGSKIATGNWNTTVQLWDVEAQSNIRVIGAHNAWVSSVAWSPDGQRIVSSSADGTVKLWGIDGSQIRSLSGHRDEVWCVRWSPNGKLLASASKDGSVRIWNATTGIEIEQLNGHTDSVWDVRWNPEGTLLATASHDGTVKVWRLRGSANSRVLQGHNANVNTIAWSPDGSRLASGARGDATLIIWNSQTGRLVWRQKGKAFQIQGVAWAPDGQAVAVSYDNGIITLFQAESGREIRSFHAAHGDLHDLCWSRDGRRIFSAGRESVIRAWQAETGEMDFEAIGHQDRILAIDISPDGKQLASVSWDRTIRIWETESGNQTSILRGHKRQILDVSWSPCGAKLATSARAGELYIWDVNRRKTIRSMHGHTRDVKSVHWTPDGSRLASSSDDHTIKIWDPITGAELSSLENHHDRVSSVSWSPDGMALASCSRDGTVRIWDATRAYEGERQLNHRPAIDKDRK